MLWCPFFILQWKSVFHSPFWREGIWWPSPKQLVQEQLCNWLIAIFHLPKALWKSGPRFCEVYLSGSRNHSTSELLKFPESELPPHWDDHRWNWWRLPLPPHLASAHVRSTIYLLTILSTPFLPLFSILPAQNASSPEQNTAMPHPGMPQASTGFSALEPEGFFSLCAQTIWEKGRRDFHCSGFLQSDFFRYILGWEDGSPPLSQQASQPGKKWDGKLNSWFKIISGWGFCQRNRSCDMPTTLTMVNGSGHESLSSPSIHRSQPATNHSKIWLSALFAVRNCSNSKGWSGSLILIKTGHVPAEM